MAAITPEDALPTIDYTITEMDGKTYNTQERVCNGN